MWLWRRSGTRLPAVYPTRLHFSIDMENIIREKSTYFEGPRWIAAAAEGILHRWRRRNKFANLIISAYGRNRMAQLVPQSGGLYTATYADQKLRIPRHSFVQTYHQPLLLSSSEPLPLFLHTLLLLSLMFWSSRMATVTHQFGWVAVTQGNIW